MDQPSLGQSLLVLPCDDQQKTAATQTCSKHLGAHMEQVTLARFQWPLHHMSKLFLLIPLAIFVKLTDLGFFISCRERFPRSVCDEVRLKSVSLSHSAWEQSNVTRFHANQDPCIEKTMASRGEFNLFIFSPFSRSQPFHLDVHRFSNVSEHMSCP